MTLPLVITGVSANTIRVGPFKTNNAPDLANGKDTGAFSFGNTGSPQNKIGQSFTTPASGLTVSTLNVKLKKTGTPTDDITVDFYATSGGLPTGASLGTSNAFAGSSLTLDIQPVTFTFATPVVLAANTQYAFVTTRSGAVDGSNFYALGATSDNPYSGGTGVDLVGSTGIWSISATIDYSFSFPGNNEAYYFIGKDSASDTTMVAYKATDPTVSWSSVAINSAGYSTNIWHIAGFQVGNVIHLIAADGTIASSVNYKYTAFDMSTELFRTVEFIDSALATGGQFGNLAVGSIVVRSNGEAVVCYNGAQLKSGGVFYARVYYSRRTAVDTWTAGVQLDAGGAIDYPYPRAALGTSDRVHFFWSPFTAIGPPQRALSSANVLQAATTGTSGNPFSSVVVPFSFNNAGTIKVVMGYASSAQFEIEYFDSADVPTMNASATNPTNMPGPPRLYNYGTTLYALYSRVTSIAVQSSTDNGATWDSAVISVAGVVIAGTDQLLSWDNNVYTRGRSVVIPYLFIDSGTTYYNEFIVQTLPPFAAFSTSQLDGQTISRIVGY